MSYGSYQLATNTGTVADFVASPEAKRWFGEFRRLSPGSTEFNTKWKQIAAKEPQAFDAAQRAYVERTHYQAAARSISIRTGYDVEDGSEAVRQVTYLTAIQHGPSGGPRLIAEAIKQVDRSYKRNDSRYERSLIETIYSLRIAHFAAKRDRELKAGQRNYARISNNVATIRLPDERKRALQMLENEN